MTFKQMQAIISMCCFSIIIASGCDEKYRPIDNGLSEIKPDNDISIDSLSFLTSDIPSDFYNDLTFIDDSTGYAVSNSGRIIKTEDGGRHWEILNSTITCRLSSIHFVDKNTGFAIGGDSQSGVFLKTQNGGSAWEVKDLETSESPTAASFLNDHTGYIAGFNLLIKTNDGGKTWHSIKDTSFRIFNDIKFKNLDEGIATCLNGKYYRTIDGGNSWNCRESLTNFHLYQVSYTTYKTFIRADGLLVALNSNNHERIIRLPTVKNILFLNEYQAVGIGQIYSNPGYFPSGVILVTNDTWVNYEKQIYTQSDAYTFTAIAKMTANKIMVIGNGYQGSIIVILHI